MKIYLASPMHQWPEMNGHQADLETLGHTVVSRWHRQHIATADSRLPISQLRRYAQEDILDIERSDLFILFTTETDTHHAAQVELGMAIQMDKSLLIVGQRRNIYHQVLPAVPDWPTAITFLATLFQP